MVQFNLFSFSSYNNAKICTLHLLQIFWPGLLSNRAGSGVGEPCTLATHWAPQLAHHHIYYNSAENSHVTARWGTKS